jgi:threonine dehydratase
MVTRDDVVAAAGTIAGRVHRTPVLTSASLERELGVPVYLKAELFQRTGSFKPRGVLNKLASLSKEEKARGVIGISAGNHAQAVAWAAAVERIDALVVMWRTASETKIAAARGYGATVDTEAPDIPNAFERLERLARETGRTLVHPYDDPLVMAGQGTVGLELLEDVPEADVVVVPVGGGGLISGVAAALAAVRPDIRVVGVEAAGAPTMTASLEAGRCVTLERLATMADGIALKSPSPLTLAHVQAHVDEVVLVGEEEISQALLLLLERAKAVVEPSGATALAAVLAGRVGGTGPVVVLLSGGNVDPLLLTKVIDHGLSAAGRYVALRVVVDDTPGSLAALAAEVARLGLNVLSVEHHRSGLDLDLDKVEIHLTLETRNAIHSGEIVADLQQAGYQVQPIR